MYKRSCFSKFSVLPIVFVCSLWVNPVAVYASEQPSAASKQPITQPSASSDTAASKIFMERKLREVKINARKSSKNSSISIQKMSGVELDRFKPQQLGEIVKQFAGVQVKDYGGIGGMKTVSVRSLGGAHTAVVYDGIVLSDAQNGQIDLSKISLESAGSVNLSNAMPGGLFESARQFSSASVIEVSRKTLLSETKKNAVEVGLTGGSFGLWSPYAIYEQKIGKKIRIAIDGKYTDVKGNYPYILENGESTEKLIRENSDVHSGYAQAKIQIDLPKNQMLDVGFHYDESNRGLPGAVIFYAPSSAQRWQERTLWGQARHYVDYGKGFAQKSFIKYEYDYTRFLDPETLNSEGIQDDRYKRQEVYVSTVAKYNIPKSPAWLFTAALDASYTSLDANLYNFAFPHRTSLWFNVAGSYKHKYVEVNANMLTSAYLEGAASGNSAQDRVRVSPSVSVGIKPLGREDLVIRLFYKDIFRMPTFNDLYYDRVGNTELTPEKAKMVDFGISYIFAEQEQISRVEIGADVYYNRVEDKIVAFPTKNLFKWSMMNIGRVNITGLDISLKADIAFGKDGFWQYCSAGIFGNYTFSNSIDVTDKTDPTYGNQIVYTPVHSGNGGLNLTFKYISLTYGFTWSGSRYCLPENIATNRLSPYIDQSLSVQGRWKMLKGEWEAAVDWINVANDSYQIVRYYPMPGNQFRISLKCRY